MKMNRAKGLIKLAGQSTPLSVLVAFDDDKQQIDAIVSKGEEETEYAMLGSYDTFVKSLEAVDVSLCPAQSFAQLVGATASRYLKDNSFVKAV